MNIQNSIERRPALNGVLDVPNYGIHVTKATLLILISITGAIAQGKQEAYNGLNKHICIPLTMQHERSGGCFKGAHYNG